MKKELTLTNKKGQKIRGCMYFPEGITSCPIVIFSHGFNGSYHDLEHYGPDFAERGIGMVLFDFCGGGLRSESDGTMLEMSVLTEKEDLLAVADAVLHMDEIACSGLFLMGESQGGYVSALAATEMEDEISGVILWYPAFILEENSAKEFVDGKAQASEIFGLKVSAKYNEDAVAVDIYKKIQNFRKKVCIIHGDADDCVPIEYSNRALKHYPNAQLHVIAGGGHGFMGEQCRKAAEICYAYIEEQKK